MDGDATCGAVGNHQEGYVLYMADEKDSSPEQFVQGLDSESVASRAEGRPAEEESSHDPDAQAQAILEDSEERIADGARAADPTDD
jgi:hypothetical protein